MQYQRPPNDANGDERTRLLDSWKEIAAYLGRSVRTVQRWEKEESLPVHRHQHLKAGTVYADSSEIEAWRRERDELGGEAARAARRWRYRLWGAAAVAAAAALAFGVVGRFPACVPAPPRSPLAFEERDWLLVANFDNTTGDHVLDGVLETGLRRELASSPFANVASRARTNDTLRLMKKPLDAPVGAALACEVALRDGAIRAVLAGRVEKLGPSYVMTANVLDPVGCVLRSSLTEEASGPEAVLPAVQRLSERVRRSLGENLSAIEDGTERLSRVSTSSLRALQLYSRAERLFIDQEMRGFDGNQGSVQLLGEALKADREFASAHIHLAWALNRSFRPPEEYLPHAERALALADGATEVERHFIEGSYLMMRSLAEGGQAALEEALAHFAALLELDPGHFWATRNAQDALRALGRGKENLTLSLRLVEARPNDVGTLAGAARALVTAEGDLENARTYVERARELLRDQPDLSRSHRPFIEFFPVHEAWASGDVETAADGVGRVVATFDGSATAGPSLALEAIRYYLDLGMWDEAESLHRRYGVPSADRWEALIAWHNGEPGPPKDLLLRTTGSRDLRLLGQVAFNLAHLGQLDEAEGILAELPEEFDLGRGYVLGARGRIHLGQGRYREAISDLERAIPLLRDLDHRGSYFYATRSLSSAWEAVGEPERGLPALEVASEQRALALRQGAWWLRLQLRLAEVYRMVGREEDARATEAELWRYCAAADDDFPVLVELRRRTKTLSGSAESS